MQKLLSLPLNLVGDFHKLTHTNPDEWFVTSDPADTKLGSGGGTTWLIDRWKEARENRSDDNRRIIIHAGGQSRRIPAYAPSGKILTPIPIFRWERGQQLRQNLLSLQLPLYERIMAKAPKSLTTLIASGDVYIRADNRLDEIPDADVVCYGLWVDPTLATRHGVFVSHNDSPESLAYMLQKPTIETLAQLSASNYFLMDIGIWLLSERALNLLMSRSRQPDAPHGLRHYDMYSDFGAALGSEPRLNDPEINSLTVAVVPLKGGEFYHYGTSRELLTSTTTVQNKVFDQRLLMQRKLKPNGTLFVQNTDINYHLSDKNDYVWVENAYVGPKWTLSKRNIVTGVPYNDWELQLAEGVCLDIVPLKSGGYALRPYGFDDAFKGALAEQTTTFLNAPMPDWMERRELSEAEIGGDTDDIQQSRIFPVVSDMGESTLNMLRWMIDGSSATSGRSAWKMAKKLSADEISADADLTKLFEQRNSFCRNSVEKLAGNYEKSVIYQLDLADLAQIYNEFGLPAPKPVDTAAESIKRIQNRMLRAQVITLNGEDLSEAKREEDEAFRIMRSEILADIRRSPSSPSIDVRSDQIVWGRSPVRIDLAGGWTDTPPYSLLNGGAVVNMGVDLNGQPPLQVYIKPSNRHEIVLRSIDMGASETVSSFEQLRDFANVGSPFSIPKAALALAGFLPEFSESKASTLKRQLENIGGGIEITLLSAVPAGSGLGTSSILAATVLGSLSDFCGLGWDKDEICRRTLALEQLLTTGGGWQDQYGGVLSGVKLLQTSTGTLQQPLVNWLPDHLFTSPGHKDCHLLYYTGITRTAKNILSEIVRGMFLNSAKQLAVLREMKDHAAETADAIQRNDFKRYGKMIASTWMQNKQLNPGTNPPSVESIIAKVSDYLLGCKLPGAGGGGFLYMVAKDPEAAVRARETLRLDPPNDRARFVEISLSDTGLKVSRS